MMTRFRPALVCPSVLVLSLAACGGSTSGGATTSSAGTGGAAAGASSSTGTGTGGATSSATSSSGTGGAASSASSGTGGTGPTSMVSFHYKPAWAGVTAVDVIGGFGQATDWDPKAPLVKLTADASGTWTGTAALPAGQYLYLFHVTGDADGPAGLARYAVDPGVSAYAACPMPSPSYSAVDVNPCSQLTVPQPPPDTEQAVAGKVVYGGQPIAGYLVLIEREETGSHHYFANRIDSAADGSFTLSAAPGKYRLQILHPTFLSETDTQRVPTSLKALRRAISASFPIGSPATIGSVEMQYLDYGSLSPSSGTATLPTTFQLTVIAGATTARAAVYGTPSGTGKNIGDPWWTSPYGTATSASFDGTFNTKQATETAVKPGESYFWGTWQTLPTTAGVAWSGESMVLPIKWN